MSQKPKSLKTTIKDLDSGTYNLINLRLRTSGNCRGGLKIRDALVKKNGAQKYLYAEKPLKSFGEGTEVIFFER